MRSENFGFACFRTERWKLVVVEDGCEPAQLFDLERNPLEERNLVADAAHRDVLEEILAREARPFFAGGRTVKEGWQILARHR